MASDCIPQASSGLGLTWRQVVWTSSAGVCIAVGYLCYFAELHAGISSPVAFGFGCAAGVTGMLYGLFVFKEYQGATRLKTLLLLLALTLNPLSIATNAASRWFQFSSVKCATE